VIATISSPFTPSSNMAWEKVSGFRCISDVAGTTAGDPVCPVRALRSVQTGQNSIPPETRYRNSGQVRLSSVFMGLTAHQPKSEPKPPYAPPHPLCVITTRLPALSTQSEHKRLSQLIK
jgi:hypothetical protein